MSISILVADDDPLLRRLLTDVLALHQDFEVLGTAGTGREALKEAARLRPQVLLLDLNMPELHGFKVLAELSELDRPPLALILSGEEDEATQLEAARNGARGFVRKTEAATTLPEAIRGVVSGDTYFSRRVMGQVLAEYPSLVKRAKKQDSPLSRLSGKEREVLTRMARGLTNQQIARELFMSLSTVKVHVRNIFQKLDLPSRTEAAVFAVREGLVQ